MLSDSGSLGGALGDDRLPTLDLLRNLSGSSAAEMVAGVDGAFELENFVDVLFDRGTEALEHIKRKVFKTTAAFGGCANRLTDNVMSRTERRAVTDGS